MEERNIRGSLKCPEGNDSGARACGLFSACTTPQGLKSKSFWLLSARVKPCPGVSTFSKRRRRYSCFQTNAKCNTRRPLLSSRACEFFGAPGTRGGELPPIEPAPNPVCHPDPSAASGGTRGSLRDSSAPATSGWHRFSRGERSQKDSAFTGCGKPCFVSRHAF